MSIYKGNTLVAAINLCNLAYESGVLTLTNSVGGTYTVTPDTTATEDSTNLITSGAVYAAMQSVALDISGTSPIVVSTVPAGTYIYTAASTYDSSASYFVANGSGYVACTVADEYVFNTDFYTYDSDNDTYTQVVSTDTYDSTVSYYVYDSESSTYSVATNQPTSTTWFATFYTRTQTTTASYTIAATFDSAVTEDSSNFVTSGAVYTAILEASPNIEGTSPVVVTATVDSETGVTTNTISLTFDEEATEDSTKLLTSGVIYDFVTTHAMSITGSAPITVTTTPAGTDIYTAATSYDSTATYYVLSDSTYTECAVADEYVFATNFYTYDSDSDTYTQVVSTDTYSSDTTYYTYDDTTLQYSVATNQPTETTWFATFYTKTTTTTPSALIEVAAATSSSLGVVQVDGETVTIDENGVISASPANTFNEDDFEVSSENEVSLVSTQRIFTGTTTEWEALSDDEKALYGVVNLTDDTATGDIVVVDEVTSGNLNPVTSNAVATANDYTTTEVATGGTWIDGKPIYRIVVETTAPTAVESLENIYDYSALNAETIISMGGYLRADAGSSKYIRYPLNNYINSSDYVAVWDREWNSTIAMSVQPEVKVGADVVLILEYTKTTD